MNKKRVMGIILVLMVCGGIALAGSKMSESGKGTITDQKGNIIAELIWEKGKLRSVCDSEYAAYTDVVCQEAVDILSNKWDLDRQDTEKKIVREELSIETWIDKKTTDVLNRIYAGSAGMGVKRCGIAVSDTEGHLLACFSDTTEADSYNNVTMPTYAGSTMKPISVYAPAIEEGIINWSMLYEDSAYMTVNDADGNTKEWPVNTVPYTGEKISIADAVKDSNNAIAVKVLKDYGVSKSLELLEDSFGYDVDKENELVDSEGEDRVLSNLALGYLEHGVTVYKMLEAYQIFANGGYYTPLHTIREVHKSGEKIWIAEEQSTRIFSEETAYIMNRMLEKVVQDGTGTSAQSQKMDVCGKTGTSEYGDHWFVGFVPETVCAVWYKTEDDVNEATAETARMCGEIFEQMGRAAGREYQVPTGVEEKEFCKKSGLLTGKHCSETGIGYYKQDNMPSVCDICK